MDRECFGLQIELLEQLLYEQLRLVAGGVYAGEAC
jgi:hypothetical protein